MSKGRAECHFRLFTSEYADRDIYRARPWAKSAPPFAVFATSSLTEHIIPIDVNKANLKRFLSRRKRRPLPHPRQTHRKALSPQSNIQFD